MQELISIVEPTLKDDTGHCMSFVNSLISTTSNIQFQVWAARKCKTDSAALDSLIKRYFFRSIRKFQIFFLYRKLLAAPGKIFIATASRLDLIVFNWIAGYRIPDNKVYLYFHWINANSKKINNLKSIAKKQPGFVIITPTQSVANVFKDVGFQNVRMAPYPTQNMPSQSKPVKQFRHAWYAGAARHDKGFGSVVDLIELTQKHNRSIPFVVQASPDHNGRYDNEILADIARLHAFTYPYLKICDKTLSSEQYHEYFRGAVCLQAYSAIDFSDRVSGVTLDALLSGCPIICSAGTWTANQVVRFNAGVVMEDISPEAMLSALEQVINKYEFYCVKAIHAGEILKTEHEASHLANAILMDVS